MAVSQSEKAAQARAAAAAKPKPPKAGAGGDGRPLTPADNLSPEERRKALEAQEEAQLLSFMSGLRAQQKKVDAAKAIFDAEKVEMNAIFSAASNAGFKRTELTPLLVETKVKGLRKNIEEAERRRNRFRRYLGLPVGNSDEQRELVERLPEAKRSELDWEADGYRAGVAAEEPTPPKDCVKAGFDQAWLRGFHNGQSRNAWALSESKGMTPMPSVPASDAPPANDPAPEIAPAAVNEGADPEPLAESV